MIDEPSPRRSQVQTEQVQVRSCPLCAASQEALRPFERQLEGTQVLNYSLCRRCGFVFQAPRPSELALEEYYRDRYHQAMAGGREGEQRNQWVQERRAAHLLQFLRAHVEEVDTHLDLGSSRGSLMMATRGAYGARTIGVEPGEEHRRLARQKGLHVVGRLEDLEPDDRNTADLITLSHVLEHVPAPAAYLGDLVEDWMAPHGYLLVEVPSLYWHPSYERAHLGAFTPGSLRTALQLAGLELVALESHGQPYSRTIPLFLLALARPATDGPVPSFRRPWPLLMRARRRAGLLFLQVARKVASWVHSKSDMRPWRGEK